MKKPIYSMGFKDQLADLKQACEMAESFLGPEDTRDIDPKTMSLEGLKEGEFAIGNWIVRPRLK